MSSGIAVSGTSASTAAKTAPLHGFAVKGSGQFVLFRLANSNSAASGVTLNINDTGAFPVVIDGVAANASNFKSGYYMAQLTPMPGQTPAYS